MRARIVGPVGAMCEDAFKATRLHWPSLQSSIVTLVSPLVVRSTHS